jgi:hypothetical protein
METKDLAYLLQTMKHARVFITSKQKMHPTGINLYDELVADIEKEYKRSKMIDEFKRAAEARAEQKMINQDECEIIKTKNIKTKTRIKLSFINGLKQKPKDLDFHITPTITFGRGDKDEIGDLGKAWGIGIEWGHWAIAIGTFTAYINK